MILFGNNDSCSKKKVIICLKTFFLVGEAFAAFHAVRYQVLKYSYTLQSWENSRTLEHISIPAQHHLYYVGKRGRQLELRNIHLRQQQQENVNPDGGENNTPTDSWSIKKLKICYPETQEFYAQNWICSPGKWQQCCVRQFLHREYGYGHYGQGLESTVPKLTDGDLQWYF